MNVFPVAPNRTDFIDTTIEGPKMPRNARNRTRSSVLAPLAALALLASCGSSNGGSSDASAPSATAVETEVSAPAPDETSPDAEEPADDPTTTTAPAETADRPSDAFCDAAAPLYAGVLAGQPTLVEKYQALATAIQAMAAASEGEQATLLSGLSASFQASADAPLADGVAPTTPPEAMEAAAECADAELVLSWDGTEISGLSDSIQPGRIAVRSSGSEPINLLVKKLGDGEDPTKVFDGSNEFSELLIYSSSGVGERLDLCEVESGRYVVVMSPKSQTEPAPQSFGVLTVG